MGAAMLIPIFLVPALLIAVVYFVGSTRRQQRKDASLPDEPYARREEEVARLKETHAEAKPWSGRE